MGATLDGERLFDGSSVEFEIGGLDRESLERGISGLDGVLRVDLGTRGRRIMQRGTLRGRSRTDLKLRVDSILGYFDGVEHVLVTDTGECFEAVVIQGVDFGVQQVDGKGLSVDYEITYKQLGA